MRILFLFFLLCHVACSETQKEIDQADAVEEESYFGPEPEIPPRVYVPNGLIKSYIFPEYPQIMLAGRVHGSFHVTAEIGKNGEVISTVGPTEPKGVRGGSHLTLKSSALISLCQWTFRPPADQKDFPMKHTVEYIFKIEGEPTPNPKVHYTIQLPDRVEITGEPHEKGMRGLLTEDFFPDDGKSHALVLSCADGKWVGLILR